MRLTGSDVRRHEPGLRTGDRGATAVEKEERGRDGRWERVCVWDAGVCEDCVCACLCI